jgi:alpha-tubulin suppressor-like RCC1 family protein
MRTGWWSITAALALGLTLAACTRGKSSDASGDASGDPGGASGGASGDPGGDSGDVSGAGPPAPPPAPAPTPAPPAPAGPGRPPPVEHIAAGDEHTCVLFRGGAVRCWGAGARGRLGTGANTSIGDDETPAAIPDIVLGGRAAQIVAGKEHTCALLDTGGVRCWGAARSGQLGYGNRRDIGDDETPASAGDVILGEPAVQITASGMHTCALLGAGRVRCWGIDTEGQLGLAFDPRTIGDDEVPTAVPAIDLGAKSGATPGATIDQLASSFAHTCALIAGGAVRCWGPVLGAGVDKLTPAADRAPVALGAPAASLGTGTAATHTCAITTAGRVRCWGLATGGPRGHGKSIAVGAAPGALPTPAELGDLPIPGRVVQVAPGSDHTCVLTVTGQVRCWGDSRFGVLGQGHDQSGRVPVESATQVDLGGRAVEIAAGGFHTCALLDTGRVRCWGWNRSGQLGYGTPENVGAQRPPAAAGDVPL